MLLLLAHHGYIGNFDALCRLLEVSGYKIVGVIPNDTPIENIMLQGNKNLRIEEVPMNETCLSESEMLVPVAHFHTVSL